MGNQSIYMVMGASVKTQTNHLMSYDGMEQRYWF